MCLYARNEIPRPYFQPHATMSRKVPVVMEDINRNLFKKLVIPDSELGLAITLNGGQSFRWVKLPEGKGYRGVFAGRVWTLTQNSANLFFMVHGPLADDPVNGMILSKYLNQDISLKANIKRWSSIDPHFRKACKTVKGVRILNQDVVENLFAFICSSNNNIVRISAMVEKLCRRFGEKLCQVDGQRYYDFPTIESLAQNQVSTILKTEGFGYRASYIADTAKELMDLGGRGWLEKLSRANGASYAMAREKLMILPGVGPKVADCVCLMSLGHLEAIPVDTHIFQVARALYMPELKNQKTVTPKIHAEVSAHLRDLWYPLAGWAQAVVFCAKLTDNLMGSTDGKRSLTKVTEASEIPKKLVRRSTN